MSKRISSSDVARRAGVSRTTVSYVMNGRTGAGIPPSTRDRVLEAAAELHYRPSAAARTLRSGRTNIVSVVVLCVYPAFYSHCIEALIAEMSDTPYELRIVETRKWSQAEWEREASDEYTAAGIIVLNETDNLPRLLKNNRTTTPIVNIGGSYLTSVDHVGVDLQSGSATAVRHLLESGRQKIVYLSALWHTRSERYAAYAAEVERAGHVAQTISFEQEAGDSSNRPAAYRAMNRYLAKTEPRDRADALFCLDDECAIGALKACREHHLLVPDDISIVGCDNIEEASYSYPSLSTIRFPFDEVAQHTRDLLLRRIEQPDIPVQGVVLTPELIIRDSSRRP